MLNIYRSNRIEVLVAHLTALLDQPDQRPADPFKPLQVVVGSQGMERFLRHELASTATATSKRRGSLRSHPIAFDPRG